MPGKVLIVQSESAPSEPLRQALTSRGFTVEVITDARSVMEQARQQRPALAVIAVELGGGQNGYLLCVKLKKDPVLQGIPVIITGNPDGFATHRKLKTHANGYLPEPADPTALVALAESLTRGDTVPPPPEALPSPGAHPGGPWPPGLRIALGLGAAAACLGGWLALR